MTTRFNDVVSARFVDFLMAYGEAKFGDEWWPSMARHYLSAEQLANFSDVLAEIDPDYMDSGSELDYEDWLKEQDGE